MLDEHEWDVQGGDEEVGSGGLKKNLSMILPAVAWGWRKCGAAVPSITYPVDGICYTALSLRETSNAALGPNSKKPRFPLKR